MRALALKELVDNGLDHAANVTLEQVDENTWSVADDGPGMDEARIATLFAVDRPLTSSKLLRRPTRGAVGNGLRVVTGAAIASGGALWVESRGRRFEVKVDLGTGRTQAVEVPCNAPPAVGTKVTIRFGAALPQTDRASGDGDLAEEALRFPGPACDPMRAHLAWYDAGSWLELARAAPVGTTVARLLAHMGIASDDQRAAVDVAFAELAKLEMPPEPKLLTRGAGGLEDFAYAKAESPGALVEAWAKALTRVPKSEGSGTLTVFVNRTPVLADASGSPSPLTAGHAILGAAGFYCYLEKVPATARYVVELSITAPVCRSSTTARPRTCRSFDKAICDAVAAAMRAAEKQLEKTATRKKGDLKDAAWEVMEEAYLKASDNGELPRLPANARQIMYPARRMIAEMIGGEPIRDKYFTQTLLPDYIAANEEECADWDVVYDARGHLVEPHTGTNVPLGTIARARLSAATPSVGLRSQHRHPRRGHRLRRRAAASLQDGAVHREGRLRAAAGAGADSRAVRLRDPLDQRHERGGLPPSARPSGPRRHGDPDRPRLRSCRHGHRPHPHGRRPALRVRAHAQDDRYRPAARRRGGNGPSRRAG